MFDGMRSASCIGRRSKSKRRRRLCRSRERNGAIPQINSSSVLGRRRRRRRRRQKSEIIMGAEQKRKKEVKRWNKNRLGLVCWLQGFFFSNIFPPSFFFSSLLSFPSSLLMVDVRPSVRWIWSFATKHHPLPFLPPLPALSQLP